LMKDMKSQAPKAICDLHMTNVSSNLIINRDAAPFDNPQIRKAMTLALDRKAFSQILGEGQLGIGAAMLPAPAGAWGMPSEELAELPGYADDPSKAIDEGRKIMEGLGYGPSKMLKLKVSTRNIPVYRDPAVILIDQLKKIYIDAELDVVDTTIWHAKVTRGEYSVGLNLTGSGVDDPDVNLVENYTCKSERNYTQYCNEEVDRAIFAQSRETDPAKRKAMVIDIQKKLIADVARPIIFYGRVATCWHPHVKGLVPHYNSIYNGSRYEQIWLDK